MMITVTKIFDFCYGHCLPQHTGKCRNVHGHNARLEVTVRRTDTDTSHVGMVIDFGDLKAVITPLIEQLDHKYINDVLHPMFLPPTAENMALWFATEIKQIFHTKGLHNLCLVSVRVYETQTSYAQWSE